jgi:hypothetical protein
MAKKKDFDISEHLGRYFRKDWNWYTLVAVSADRQTAFCKGVVKEAFPIEELKPFLIGAKNEQSNSNPRK